MLSKEDYNDYLNQIEKIEKDMKNIYDICVTRVEDESIKKVFIELLADETRHVSVVESMKQMMKL